MRQMILNRKTTNHLQKAADLLEQSLSDQGSYLTYLEQASIEMDKARGIDDIELERESLSEKKKIVYKKPTIIELDIKVRTHGNYKTTTGYEKGLVIHYTAGHRDKGRTNAERTLKGLAERGLGCLVMDLQGNIYKSKYQDFHEVAYHAGKSKWKGKSGMSNYCHGMEICCAGKLTKKGGKYYEWWKIDRKTKKVKFGQKPVPEKNIRYSKGIDNIAKGAYLAFTEKQETALKNYILWRLDVNPEFNLEWVVGHDSVSPKRKTDPGASLSMSIPQYRKSIAKIVAK